MEFPSANHCTTTGKFFNVEKIITRQRPVSYNSHKENIVIEVHDLICSAERHLFGVVNVVLKAKAAWDILISSAEEECLGALG